MASAKFPGAPGAPAGAPELGVSTFSPLASCSITLGFSNCDLSVFLRAPIPPAPLIEAKRASLPPSTAGKGGAGPESAAGGGGGGGGAPIP